MEAVLVHLTALITVTNICVITTFILTFSFLRKKQISFIEWNIGSPRHSALISLGAMFISFIITMLFHILLDKQQDISSTSGNTHLLASTVSFSAGQAISHLIFYFLAALPILIAMKWQKETLTTAGISTLNLRSSLFLGLSTSGVALIAVFGFLDAPGFSSSFIWIFIQFSFVGFFEEFLYRGYLQTRLMRWLGTYQGWTIASVLMALSHISIIYYWHDKSLVEAFLISSRLIPMSLAFGYLYMKTGNILGPALAHAFMNFATTIHNLGQITTDI